MAVLRKAYASLPDYLTTVVNPPALLAPRTCMRGPLTF